MSSSSPSGNGIASERRTGTAHSQAEQIARWLDRPAPDNLSSPSDNETNSVLTNDLEKDLADLRFGISRKMADFAYFLKRSSPQLSDEGSVASDRSAGTLKELLQSAEDIDSKPIAVYAHIL